MTNHNDIAQHWNQRYRENSYLPLPAQALLEYGYLLPATGKALDLACGLGANALFLAERGLETWAWDISSAAINQLNETLTQIGFTVHAEVRDVTTQPFPINNFDVIVVSRFLERSLKDAIKTALRPGGLLFYQTFSKLRIDYGGPCNPDFLLDDNELLSLFAGLKVRVYREETCLGDTRQGFRNEAMLIAQREF
jgi:SAM-dependent methyltransferase